MTRLVALTVLLAPALGVACGSSSSTGAGGGHDASTDGASPVDATADGLAPEGGEGAATDAGDGATDAPTPPDAGGDASPDADASRSDCPGDAAVRYLDAGSPLSFVEIGAADRPVDLSADGVTALIQDGASATGDLYFYDTVTGALTLRARTGDPSLDLATSLSGDARRVGAYRGKASLVGGVWDSCAGWTDLADTYDAGCPPDQSGVFGLNGDGTVAVGNVWNGCASAAALWTETGGAWKPAPLQHLGMPGGNERATQVSDDGRLLGGFVQFPKADRNPAVWHADGTGTLLDPSHKVIGEVLSVSPDGQMVAGIWNQDGFTWTPTAGVVDAGKLAGAAPSDSTFFNDIAAGHQLVVGGCGDPNPGGLGNPVQAIVWTAARGMRALGTILAARKITLPKGYVLTDVMAASADGTVLLGFATDTLSATHTFVLRLPVSAYGL